MNLDYNLAKEFLSRYTYKRFLKVLKPSEYKYKKLVQSFIDKVIDENIEFYQEWEPGSMKINDFLQSTFVDTVKKEMFSNNTFPVKISEIIFSSRMIKVSLIDWFSENQMKVNDEVIEMFIWACYFNDKDWFLQFVPFEYHQGVVDWRGEISSRWKKFEKNIQS